MPETAGQYAGATGVVLALIAFMKFFLWNQIKDLRRDVTRLRDDMARIEAKYDEERGRKHKAFNDVARATMALELVRRLAESCTCGVLDPLTEIIERLFAEMETIGRARRHNDPPEGASA
jgi:hypothetical protein